MFYFTDHKLQLTCSNPQHSEIESKIQDGTCGIWLSWSVSLSFRQDTVPMKSQQYAYINKQDLHNDNSSWHVNVERGNFIGNTGNGGMLWEGKQSTLGKAPHRFSVLIGGRPKHVYLSATLKDLSSCTCTHIWCVTIIIIEEITNLRGNQKNIELEGKKENWKCCKYHICV